MSLSRNRCFLVLIVLGGAVMAAHSRDARPPFKPRELIALTSGGALSENIVHETNARGLAFRPTEEYRSLLATSGGDASVLTALNAAKVNDGNPGGATEGADKLLQNLATAGKLIRAKQYVEASALLTDALDLQFNGAPETGFVIGELFRRQEHWPEAEAVYVEVLRRNADFPEVHTKLSYIEYRLGEQEEALREARAALAQNPENAEAHKNAGLALQSLQRFTASEQEYQEALHIKPDYSAAHEDMGIVLAYEGKYDEAIAEYKKAIALAPNESDYHDNLGISYRNKGDLDSAIREFRESKRLNPSLFEPRQELGSALLARNMNAQAVVELRELEAMFPNSPICHDCFATALFRTWDLQGGEKEFRKAIEIDPSDANARVGLGEIKETQKDYDAALDEYRQAQRLDSTSVSGYRDAGRVLLAKNDVAAALVELKRAENVKPSDVDVHDLYGQALELSGNHAAAIAEFKQTMALDPKQIPTQLRLAAALEKNQNWVDALDQYRKAALSDRGDATQSQYRAAQARADKLIASMEASGRSAEAAKLKASLLATQTNPSTSEKVDAAMQAGFQAMSAKRLDEAGKYCKQAVDLAEKLQPHDDRLATSLGCLANVYAGKNDFAQVEVALQRELKVNEEMYGPESPKITGALVALGSYRIFRHEYDSALDFFDRAVAINEKTFGEASAEVANSLMVEANVYMAQQAYDKAEPYLLRAMHINEALFGKGGADAESYAPLWYLCNLYDKWDKPDKAEPCYRQMVTIYEGIYGANSPLLLSILTAEAKALRGLGRVEEAGKVDQRLQTLREAQTAP